MCGQLKYKVYVVACNIRYFTFTRVLHGIRIVGYLVIDNDRIGPSPSLTPTIFPSPAPIYGPPSALRREAKS